MTSEECMKMGIRLGEIRRGSGMTQEQVAERLDVTAKHVSHVESGDSTYSLRLLTEFCRLMDCSMDYVVFGHREDSVISKLPSGIADILYHGNTDDVDRLYRYLEMFLELQRRVR